MKIITASFWGMGTLLALAFGVFWTVKTETVEGEVRIENIEKVFLPKSTSPTEFVLTSINGIPLVSSGSTVGFLIEKLEIHQEDYWQRMHYVNIKPEYTLRVVRDVPQGKKSWVIFRNGIYKRRTFEQFLRDLERGTLQRSTNEREVEYGYVEVHASTTTIVLKENEKSEWRSL